MICCFLVCDMAVPSNFTACHFNRSRWYYDKSLDTCVKFKGPCTVKGNMFMSRKLCEDNCIKRGKFKEVKELIVSTEIHRYILYIDSDINSNKIPYRNINHVIYYN